MNAQPLTGASVEEENENLWENFWGDETSHTLASWLPMTDLQDDKQPSSLPMSDVQDDQLPFSLPMSVLLVLYAKVATDLRKKQEIISYNKKS